jgi:hypothetical protein
MIIERPTKWRFRLTGGVLHLVHELLQSEERLKLAVRLSVEAATKQILAIVHGFAHENRT